MKKKILLLFVFVAVIFAFFLLDLKRFVSFEYLVEQRESLLAYYQGHRALTLCLFFFLYVFVTASSIPVATVLSLAAGAIFGLFLGTLLVSFASTVGATLAFLSSRYLMRNVVQERFARQMELINSEFAREGVFYLFFLRLVPAFPFFVINLLMGLTRMRAVTFYCVSQLAMLPATFVYVNAGTEIGKLRSLDGILSPGLLLSLALLGLFPLLSQKFMRRFRVK